MKLFTRGLVLGLIGLFMVPNVFASPAPYPDVESYKSNFEAVTQMLIQGVFSGYPDGTFRGDQPINRAELAKVLVEAYGFTAEDLHACAETPASISFSDVNTGQWYAPYVKCARTKGWIQGDDDTNGDHVTTFRPADPVNVAEATKMVTLSQLGGVGSAAGGSNWFDVYINALKGKKIVEVNSPYDKNPLRFTYTTAWLGLPRDNVERADVAEFLYRLGFSNYDPRKALSDLSEFDQSTYDTFNGKLSFENDKYGFRFDRFNLADQNPNDLKIFVEDPSGAMNGFYSTWQLLAPNHQYSWPYDYSLLMQVRVFDKDYYNALLAQGDTLTWDGKDYEANGLVYQVSCSLTAEAPALEEAFSANCDSTVSANIGFTSIEI